MNAIALTPQPPGTGSTDPKHLRKIADAARDFEAVLLNMLIKSLEESFSAMPGGDRPVGSESYRDFESEALAASLAARGGLGIARMIAENLQKANDLDSPSLPKVQASGGR